MKIIYCDVCKKPIENPQPTRNLFHIADIDICEPCKDDLDLVLRHTYRGKKPFDYGWSDEFVMKVLHEGMEHGKIDVRVKR